MDQFQEERSELSTQQQYETETELENYQILGEDPKE